MLGRGAGNISVIYSVDVRSADRCYNKHAFAQVLHLPPMQCTLRHAVASSVVILTSMFVHHGLHHVTASSQLDDACACCKEHDMHGKEHGMHGEF